MFVLDLKGNELVVPETRPPPYKPPKLSECSPLFMLVRLSLSFSSMLPSNFPPLDCPPSHGEAHAQRERHATSLEAPFRRREIDICRLMSSAKQVL